MSFETIKYFCSLTETHPYNNHSLDIKSVCNIALDQCVNKMQYFK